MSIELRKINNYRFTNANIDEIIVFLTQNQQPANMNQRQLNRFLDKFDNGDWQTQNNQLFYRPNPSLNLGVARPQDIQHILNVIFQDFQQGLGTGQNQFHTLVASHCLNIKRVQTTAFLKRQGNYHLPRQYEKIINKPILANVANERWGMDLINLDNPILIAANHSHRFILVVVDYFSRKVFAKPLMNAQSNTMLQMLQQIIQASGTLPRLLQVDNGAEFQGNNFLNFCIANRITLVRVNPYTPTTNGLVERMNKEVRKKIANGYVRNNSLVWDVHLPDYIENINNQKNYTTKMTPNQLWTPAYQPLQHAPQNHQLTDRSTDAERREHTQFRLRATAQAQLARGRQPNDFFVGDRVRVKMTRFHTALRRLIENRRGKQIIVKYTPEIYTISQVRLPQIAGEVKRTQYELLNPQNQLLIRNGNPVLFYGNELILVPPNSVASNVLTAQQGNVLNRV